MGTVGVRSRTVSRNVHASEVPTSGLAGVAPPAGETAPTELGDDAAYNALSVPACFSSVAPAHASAAARSAGISLADGPAKQSPTAPTRAAKARSQKHAFLALKRDYLACTEPRKRGNSVLVLHIACRHIFLVRIEPPDAAEMYTNLYTLKQSADTCRGTAPCDDITG